MTCTKSDILCHMFDYVIHNSEFLVEYVAEGETVEFTICPEFSGYWSFEVYSGGHYGYLHVYHPNGSLIYGGGDGHHRFYDIYLAAGEEYKVEFSMNSTSYENYVAFSFVQTIIDTPTTLYYYTDSWSDVYVFLWNWDEVNGLRSYTNWPGYAMTPVEGMAGWYTITVDCNVDRDLYLIFTDWSEQTADLTYDGNAWWFGETSYATKESAEEAIAIPVEPVEVTLVYLVPSENWIDGDSRFAAYMWDDQGCTWADFVKVEGEDNLYVAEIPVVYTNIIFCRMNPETTKNNWNNKWNQTSDLVLDGINNCYIIEEGSWDRGNGTWTVYSAPVVE